MMEPDTCGIIPDAFDPVQSNTVTAKDISHLRNYLSAPCPETSKAPSSLSGLMSALGMTEEELAEMYLNTPKRGC